MWFIFSFDVEKKDKLVIETMSRVVYSDTEYAQCEYLSLQIECFVARM
jgi:hypothetical protein